jgi:hypothetical protein
MTRSPDADGPARVVVLRERMADRSRDELDGPGMDQGGYYGNDADYEPGLEEEFADYERSLGGYEAGGGYSDPEYDHPGHDHPGHYDHGHDHRGYNHPGHDHAGHDYPGPGYAGPSYGGYAPGGMITETITTTTTYEPSTTRRVGPATQTRRVRTRR